MAYEFFTEPDVLNASGRSRPRWVSSSGGTDFPLPEDSVLNMSGISDVPRRSSIAPSALYSQIDRQMLGIKGTKRRSKSGTYNVRALDAIVGLAASGYFNPPTKKRKVDPPMQTALGFINVPTCLPGKKRVRFN